MARVEYGPGLEAPFSGVVFTLDAIGAPEHPARAARLRHRRVLRAWEQAVLTAREAPRRVPTLHEDAARAAGVGVGRLRRVLAAVTPRLSPIEGLPALLAAMDRHDLPRALVSDRPAPLGQLGAGRGWAAVVCGEEVGLLRPSPALLAPVAEALGVPIRALALVGAGPLDEALAEAAGCPLLLRGRDWQGPAAVGQALLGGTWTGYSRQMKGSTRR